MRTTKAYHPRRVVAALALALALSCVLVALTVAARPAQATFPGENGPIAYSFKDSSGKAQIYTIPSTGGEPTQISPDEYGSSWSPVFSPDGTKIAYSAHYRRCGCDQIYTVHSTGGRPTRITGTTSSVNPTSWGSAPQKQRQHHRHHR
jgi:Tol biopolymer transport system component